MYVSYVHIWCILIRTFCFKVGYRNRYLTSSLTSQHLYKAINLLSRTASLYTLCAEIVKHVQKYQSELDKGCKMTFRVVLDWWTLKLDSNSVTLGQINFKYLQQKIFFAPWVKTKLGEKEFLKSYTVLLRAELTCTIKSSQTGRVAGAL